MNDLDKRIQDMALNNWQLFVERVGEDAIIQAKAITLREEGKSYNQISVRLKITLSQVRWACSKIKADKKCQLSVDC